MLVQDPVTGRAVDPRLVYALDVLGKTFVPRVYTMHAVFAAGNAGQEITSTLDESVPSDTVIKSVEFTIRQPNQFVGNILKPQYASFFMQASQIEVLAETFGVAPSQCVKVTADGPMPLESFARSASNTSGCFQSAFGADFILPDRANLRITTRSLVALAGNEVPTEVVYTFKCEQIDSCCVNTISMQDALAYMKTRAAR